MSADLTTINSRMKRMGVILLAFVIAAAVWTAAPLEASADTAGSFTFTSLNGKATITGYTGSATTLTIPSTLTNAQGSYLVTGVGDSAFYNYSSLTNITIPSSVTSIGNSAFSYCRSLTSIIIPSNVESIGSFAFFTCTSLKTITIPSSVKSIGNNAFSYCSSLASMTIIASSSNVINIGEQVFSHCSSLTSVTIPLSMKSIGVYMFYNCDSLSSIIIPSGAISIGAGAFSACSSLTRVEIPSSITNIGSWAFDGCNSLISIDILNGNNSYSSLDGVLFDKTQKRLFRYPPGKGASSYTIPSSVTSIEDSAFDSCSSLTNMTIPANVTLIHPYAFYKCLSLTSITIPSSVTSIGSDVFNGCSKLTIRCYKDSATYNYAVNNDNSYILLSDVTFETNGGSTLSSNKKTVGQNEAYGDLPSPTRAQYSFAGWYTSATDGSLITKDMTVTASQNHTLYAHWEAINYTVTLNVNGGNALSANTLMVERGAPYGNLPSPTRALYAFVGWYTSASGGSLVTKNTAVTASQNHTLYAHWKVQTQLLDANGDGKDDETGTAVPWHGFDGPNGDRIPNGWNGITGSPPQTSNPTSGITTYPISEKTYMVMFTPGDDSMSKVVTVGKKYGKLPIAKEAKGQQKFLGWYTKKSGGKKITSESIVEMSKDHTLYAHWKANKYKVTFKASARKKISKVVTYGEKYGKLPKGIDKNGQLKFIGWYTKESGGKKITAKSIVTITKNTTLYAHWKRR